MLKLIIIILLSLPQTHTTNSIDVHKLDSMDIITFSYIPIMAAYDALYLVLYCVHADKQGAICTSLQSKCTGRLK